MAIRYTTRFGPTTITTTPQAFLGPAASPQVKRGKRGGNLKCNFAMVHSKNVGIGIFFIAGCRDTCPQCRKNITNNLEYLSFETYKNFSVPPPFFFSQSPGGAVRRRPRVRGSHLRRRGPRGGAVRGTGEKYHFPSFALKSLSKS